MDTIRKSPVLRRSHKILCIVCMSITYIYTDEWKPDLRCHKCQNTRAKL